VADFDFSSIIAGLQDGSVVPYIGPGVLADSHNASGDPIPADSDSLIHAMNNGQPMAPRLMYEFPRAAMHIELKRGRKFLTKFLNELYGEQQWSRAGFHDWLATLKPSYVIDINRDVQLQESYADTPHIMVNGVARIGGTDYRFKIYHYDGKEYKEVEQEDVDVSLPVLFKPMGTPLPASNYIASDADYVDYITELMGGFAIPSFMKESRMGKQYVLIGMRLTRDSERMVMADITWGCDEPRGWALIKEPTAKEIRYCKRMGIEIIDADHTDLINAAGANLANSLPDVQTVGC